MTDQPEAPMSDARISEIETAIRERRNRSYPAPKSDEVQEELLVEIRRLRAENEALLEENTRLHEREPDPAVILDEQNRELRAENERLKKFAAAIFDTTFQGYDPDGEDIQTLGLKHGLLEPREVDPSENEWGADELYFMTFEIASKR